MKKILGGLAAVFVLVFLLAGCSPDRHSTKQSFPFTGHTLDIISSNATMPVSVNVSGDSKGVVTAEVHSETLGKGARIPAWSLSRDTLTLGSPCSSSWVGYCEASFTVTVPDGTEVRINGKPAG